MKKNSLGLEALFSEHAIKSKDKLLSLVNKETAIEIINKVIKPTVDEPDYIYWNLVEKEINKE